MDNEAFKAKLQFVKDKLKPYNWKVIMQYIIDSSLVVYHQEYQSFIRAYSKMKLDME